ncbi:MAG: efflux RND transporter periplasmic adaptor subunit [Epsilonproteobacteria bacterium]|nr:efflux RND transporter periplasmic adaptor subunit [Campylobacterota bacterium]
MKLTTLFFTVLLCLSAPLSAKQAFNVKTVEVKKVLEGSAKEFYGYTKANEESVKEIALRYDAFIEQLYVNKNFLHVKKGEPLAKLYSQEIYTAELELVNAGRIKSESMVQSIAQKLKLLGVDEKTISKIMTDKNVPESITIVSPYTGIVTQKAINQGAFVPKGAKLYEISDYTNLWLIVKVYEKDLEFVKRAQNADIFFDMSSKPYKAKIDFIYPKVVPQTKSVDVRLVIENKELEIYENAFAKARFGTAKREYLALPKSAVMTKGAKTSVFVKGEFEGEYEPREIEAKRLNNDTFEIVSGLKEGDVVVANALFMFDADAQNNGGAMQ